MLSIVLYPISEFCGNAEEFSGTNHGPLYFINDYPNANLADKIMVSTVIWAPTLTLLLSIIFAINTLFRRGVKHGLMYYVPALISVFLMVLQLFTVFWLVD